MFFLLFLLDDRRVRIRMVSLTNGSRSRRPKNIMDPYGPGFGSGSATLVTTKKKTSVGVLGLISLC
jgi:hypothetical protein